MISKYEKGTPNDCHRYIFRKKYIDAHIKHNYCTGHMHIDASKARVKTRCL